MLAIEWARGRFLSPVICEIGGEVTRGGRAITILPGPRHARPALGRVLFRDLDAAGATRCFDDLGGEQPNIEGRVDFRLPGRSHPETARRDFEVELRRSSGFEFHVAAGRLRLQPVGEPVDGDPPEAGRLVDFTGGTATLRLVAEGSDDARLLADLTGLRKLALELRAQDGTTLRFPLVMTRTR